VRKWRAVQALNHPEGHHPAGRHFAEASRTNGVWVDSAQLLGCELPLAPRAAELLHQPEISSIDMSGKQIRGAAGYSALIGS
jgi:hypothetical protein